MTLAKTVGILQKESYLAAIQNSIGTELFRNLYGRINGIRKDLTKDGVAACAVFVSSVLMLHHLIDATRAPHATVESLETNLKRSGWKKTKNLIPGNVIVWEPLLQVDTLSSHVGFFVEDEKAISNDWRTRVPAEHHITFGTTSDGSPMRAIIAIYTYEFKS